MLASGYAVYGPDQVTQAGNGYITTARYLPPEQFDRVSGGAPGSGPLFNNRNVSSASPDGVALRDPGGLRAGQPAPSQPARSRRSASSGRRRGPACGR